MEGEGGGAQDSSERGRRLVRSLLPPFSAVRSGWLILAGHRSSIMYAHRAEVKRFDCVDLDPYGSAVPFLDAAIGATADGGE